MTPKYNLAMNRGETFQKTFTYLDANGAAVDLTPYTVQSQIKAAYTDTTASATFTASIPSPTSGEFQLVLHPSSSALLTGSCYLYDVRLTSGSFIRYVLEGKVHVSPSVTL